MVSLALCSRQFKVNFKLKEERVGDRVETNTDRPVVPVSTLRSTRRKLSLNTLKKLSRLKQEGVARSGKLTP